MEQLLKRAEALNRRLARDTPFDMMLRHVAKDDPQEHHAAVKQFTKMFATGLLRSGWGVINPDKVLGIARNTAKAVGTSTPRGFNLGALLLGQAVRDAWKKYGDQMATASFVEGFHEALKENTPMNQREWDDAIEYALGYAGVH